MRYRYYDLGSSGKLMERSNAGTYTEPTRLTWPSLSPQRLNSTQHKVMKDALKTPQEEGLINQIGLHQNNVRERLFYTSTVRKQGGNASHYGAAAATLGGLGKGADVVGLGSGSRQGTLPSSSIMAATGKCAWQQ